MPKELRVIMPEIEKFLSAHSEYALVKMINDNDKSISYSNNNKWGYEKKQDSEYYNSDVHITNKIDAYFECSFWGTGFILFGGALSEGARIEVQIDDKHQGIKNISAATDSSPLIAFQTNELKRGKHNAKVILMNGEFAFDALYAYT